MESVSADAYMLKSYALTLIVGILPSVCSLKETILLQNITEVGSNSRFLKLLCEGRSCETLFCSGIVVRSLVLSFAFSFRYRDIALTRYLTSLLCCLIISLSASTMSFCIS